MDRGLFGNSAVGAWVRYKPDVLCAGSGALTQPFFDTVDGSYQFGRWLYDPVDGQVSAQIQTEFIGASTIGAGPAYVWKLPQKARRPPAFAGLACPLIIGRALCYFSFPPAGFPAANMPCMVTLADPLASLGGAEDYYCQIYAPEIWDWGTGASIANGQPGVTVNHRAGYAFGASDLSIVNTNGAGANIGSIYAVPSITATTFQAKICGTGQTNTGAAQTFDWKVRATPPAGSTGALVSPTVPWDWSRFTALTPFGNIFIELEYEPA